MTRKEALTILCLNEGADAEEIKRSYRKMAFALHPDLNPDNPAAGKEFQRLNEAYVLLTSPSSPDGGQRSAPRGQRAGAQAEAKEKARADAERAYARAKKRFQEEAAKSGPAKPSTGSAQKNASPGKTREMKRDEVLHDLLRDPFARRVFEDIYTQIREESARKQAAGKTRSAKAPQEPGILERTVENAQDWFRRQIDDEQTVRFNGPLTPGARVRLQIHHGIFGKAQTIELTLPPEFEPGRPLRLKGLGRRIGKWRGDLYLRIVGQ